MRAWRVEVDGFPPYVFYGSTRSKARYAAAESLNETYDMGMTLAFCAVKSVVLATSFELDNLGIDREILETDRQPCVRQVNKKE